MAPKSGSAELLAALRAAMAAQGLAALVVPSEGQSVLCVDSIVMCGVDGMCCRRRKTPLPNLKSVHAKTHTRGHRRAPVGVHAGARPPPGVCQRLLGQRGHG